MALSLLSGSKGATSSSSISRQACCHLNQQFLSSFVQRSRFPLRHQHSSYSIQRSAAYASIYSKFDANDSDIASRLVTQLAGERVYSRIISRTHQPSTTATPETRSDNDSDSIDSSNLASRYFSQRDAKFLVSATKPAHYESIHNPEITFAGRSNVGKSSLIGAVLRSAPLVKTSKKPGHTSTLNFFHLSSRAHPAAISVVDMPGYGYRSRDDWGAFIVQYLSTRDSLRRVFLLVEAKVGELKATDRSFLEIAENSSTPVQIVLTKTDKLKRAELTKTSSRLIDSAKQIAPSVVQPCALCCSARTKTGISTLQEEILRVCGIESK